MINYDIIWGNYKITDTDVLKIINHKSMQRLKNIYISTYGYLFNIQRNSTRFEHCIGVYLLLNKFGASKKEQIAGLIHDISQTAFSHLSTYALQGEYKGIEYHEIMHKKFIQDTGLDKLLIKLGYDPEELTNEENFSLLEKQLPDLCADRIDYALRDGLHLQILSRQKADSIISGIKVMNNEFIFKDKDSAYEYAFDFYLLNLLFYGSSSEAHFNNDFGRLIKYAIRNNVLKNSDWFSDDVSVVNKLRNSKNTKILKWIGSYNNKLITYEDSENPSNIFPKKIRVVDPKVFYNKKIYKLSELDPLYKRMIETYKKTHSKHELAIKVIHRK